MSRSVQLRQCIRCDNLFEDWVGVERHTIYKHEGKRCTICDKIFSDVQQLTKHIDEYIDISVECFSCRRCEEKFSQVIKRHEQNCHSFSAGGRQEVRGSGGRQEARGSGGYWETEAGKEILPLGQGPGGNQDAMV